MFATSTIAGNLTADPELKHVQSGGNDLVVTDFTIAINERQKSGDEKSYFFNIRAWGRQAQAICDYMRKGDRMAVACKVQQDRWQDKDSGAPRMREYHLVQRMLFAPKKALDKAEGTDTKTPPKNMTTHQLAEKVPMTFEGSDDDIPF
jgi:single-strand DNA-binding protein